MKGAGDGNMTTQTPVHRTHQSWGYLDFRNSGRRGKRKKKMKDLKNSRGIYCRVVDCEKKAEPTGVVSRELVMIQHNPISRYVVMAQYHLKKSLKLHAAVSENLTLQNSRFFFFSKIYIFFFTALQRIHKLNVSRKQRRKKRLAERSSLSRTQDRRMICRCGEQHSSPKLTSP